jgi:hypothetical protein
MTVKITKPNHLTASDIQYNLDVLAGKIEYPSLLPEERKKISPAEINTVALEFLAIFAKEVKSLEKKERTDKQAIARLKADITSITSYVYRTIEQRNPSSLTITSQKKTPVSTSTLVEELASRSTLSPAETDSSPATTQLTTSSLPLPPANQLRGNLCGIPNRINTCFINAAFQMIMNDSSLTEETLMAYIRERERLQREGKQHIEAEYYNACETMVNAILAYQEGRIGELDLNPLRALLKIRGASDNGVELGSMGDAEEFFYALIYPVLHPAIIGTDQSVEYLCVPYIPSTRAEVEKYSQAALLAKRERPKLNEGRLTRNQTNFDSIIRLEPEAHAQGQELLQRLLTAKPHIGEPIACDDGWYVPVAERLILDPLPNRIVVSIRRFKPTLSGIVKNEDPVHMQETLKIGEQNYHLKSIALHSDAHYKAYIQKNGVWHTADDNVISRTSDQELRNSLDKGYLYYYEKA